jgi:hypothetical protein
MRLAAVALCLALSTVPGVVLAQSGPPPGSPPESGPPPGAYPPSEPRGAITRDQFVQRAVDRATKAQKDPQKAAERAGARFDQMDTGHTGVLTRAQMKAWRAAHPHSRQPPA